MGLLDTERAGLKGLSGCLERQPRATFSFGVVTLRGRAGGTGRSPLLQAPPWE